MSFKQNQSRREFLRTMGKTAMVGAAAPLGINLATIGEAAALNATDYKALVCIFLRGGNDHYNTLIPYDIQNYNKFRAIRPSIGADRPSTPLSILNRLPSNSLQLGLNNQMVGMKNLFNTANSDLAILTNVGNLQVPTTLAQYKAKSVPLPPKLFSHNDQSSIWESGQPEGATTGIGGKLADIAHASNNRSMFANISLSGNSPFLSGNQTQQYHVGNTGAVPIKQARIGGNIYNSVECNELLHKLITRNRSNFLEQAINEVNLRSIVSQQHVTTALSNINSGLEDQLDSYLPNTNDFNKKLKMIAKLIDSRVRLGDLKRQVFFVTLDGFDSHDALLVNHPQLLKNLSDGMTGFNHAMKALGTNNQVTTFTTSEFGRSFSANGDGCDHGWGSHHFIMGGAVNGGKVYGQFPEVALKTNVDVGYGRLLPTTSTTQYFAELATWFGVTQSELPLILPNISEFSLNTINFMSS